MSTVDNGVQIEQDIYRMLTKTFLLLDDCDRRFLADYGLSTRQFWAVQHLDRQQGCSMVDLSRVLFTDKSNVTSIVDRLEQLKLVARTPDPRDRRVTLVMLTPEGQHLRDKVNAQHQDLVRNLIHLMSNASLHSLLGSLQTISRNIEDYLASTNET